MSLEPAVVEENLALARAAVAAAAARSGRPAGAVELLAAVKYVEPADLAVLADVRSLLEIGRTSSPKRDSGS